MKVFIWKYADNNMNYFEEGFSDNYIDKICITKILDIPSFNEEFNSKNDFNEIKAGDFTVTLSLLDDAKSSNGDNLHDFFFANDRNNKYLVVIQFKEPDVYNDLYSRRCGLIDLNSIEKDTTVSKNKWQVTFTVDGMMRELAEYFSASDMADAYHNEKDIYFDYYLYGSNNPQYPALLTRATSLRVNNCLELPIRLGFNPKLSSPIHHDILNIHYAENKENINRWTLFKELAKGFGFVYRLVCVSNLTDMVQHPNFELVLFWRSDGLKNVNLKILEDNEVISNIYNNKWIYQANRHEILRFGEALEQTMCMGWASNGKDTFNWDKVITSINFTPTFIVAASSSRWGWSGSDLIIKSGTAPQIIVPWQDVLSFNEILYITSGMQGKFRAGSITFPRCFVKDWNIDRMNNYSDSGTEQIKENTAIPDYKFLLSGMKSLKKVKLYMDDLYELSIFCTTRSFNDGKTYWCQRIDNLNIHERTADCEFVEV